MATAVTSRSIPRAFVWRRLHSLTGLFFLLFLLEHMFTNSQAALFFGANAMWFVNSVNFLHSLPYLPFIELFLLGVPLGLHAFLGIKYLFSSKSNVVSKRGKASVQKHERNWAYTMQRVSSWIILVGLILHVVQMRFIMYPIKVHMGNHSEAFGAYTVDPGLYKVSEMLGLKIYDQNAINEQKKLLEKQRNSITMVDTRLEEMQAGGQLQSDLYSKETNEVYKNLVDFHDREKFVYGLTYFTLKPNEVIVSSKTSADLILLNVRQAFQNPWMCFIYTLFVLASVLHGCNGFWTFCITWGLLLSRRAQNKFIHFSYGLAFVMLALATLAIWGSYFFSTGYYN